VQPLVFGFEVDAVIIDGMAHTIDCTLLPRELPDGAERLRADWLDKRGFDAVPNNVDVIRRLNVAFNANDLDALQSLLDPNVEFVDHLPLPDIQAAARGVEEVTSVLEHWRAGSASFQAEVVDYLDLGAYVVCSTRWKFQSRDEGIEIDWPGAEAYQVRDGKLVWSAVGFRDAAAAIKAVEERSGTGAKRRRE
jgi:ketosteroid isomerase-like protein